jgi:putative salt-induced outer membrane protein
LGFTVPISILRAKFSKGVFPQENEMRVIVKNGFIALAALVFSTVAISQEADEEKGWTGKGEFGLVKTSGNTDTESLILGVEFINEQDKWRHRAAANALSADDSGTTTAERYGFEWQSDYKLDDKSWVLGAFRYESDEFSAYDNQQTLTFGYGRNLLDNNISKLVGEIGIGFRDAELLNGMTESGAIVRGLLDYTRQVTDNSEFTNRFLVESGSDNTFLQNLMGFSVSMNDRMAMKFGFEYRHNTDVPFGVDDTDTITSANLVVNFQ